MKKIVLIIAFLVIGLGAMAQTMKVQSAYSDMKNNRLSAAIKNIEAACENDNTKNDAKTWHYAGLIYAKVLEVSSTDEKLFKRQKIETPLPELATKSKNALLKSMELELANKTNEYLRANQETMKFIIRYQLDIALNEFNSSRYQESIPMFEDISLSASKIGDREVKMKADFCVAMAYDAIKQKDKAAAMYRQLVKEGTKEEPVYINLFIVNRQNKETDKAINVLKAGVKNIPTSYTLYGLLSGAYMEVGNKEEASKCIEVLKQISDTITKDKPNVLVTIANSLRDGGSQEEAIKYFNQSLSLEPNQTGANYGLGVLYFNWAADLSEKANETKSDSEYEQLKLEAKGKFNLAIPYFEKVLSINPKDIGTLNALKTIYARLEMTEKYKEVNAKLESLIKK